MFRSNISEALQDFDILEDGFHRFQNARVLAADYDLLRQHLGFQGEDLWANSASSRFVMVVIVEKVFDMCVGDCCCDSCDCVVGCYLATSCP